MKTVRRMVMPLIVALMVVVLVGLSALVQNQPVYADPGQCVQGTRPCAITPTPTHQPTPVCPPRYQRGTNEAPTPVLCLH